MDHPTYLEKHLALTDGALANLHLLLGREDYAEATAYLAKIRGEADSLWQARVATATRENAEARRERAV